MLQCTPFLIKSEQQDSPYPSLVKCIETYSKIIDEGEHYEEDKGTIGELRIGYPKWMNTELYEAQDLWLTVDEEILKGDHYIHTGTTHNYPQTSYHYLYECDSPTRRLTEEVRNNTRSMTGEPLQDVLYVDGMFASDCRKVIATSHRKAMTPEAKERGIHHISEELLKAYVTSQDQMEFVLDDNKLLQKCS